jgi:hypothetical protein
MVMSKEAWRRLWSNADAAFSEIWWVDGPHDLIRKTVESGWLPPGSSILEIGCGGGNRPAG